MTAARQQGLVERFCRSVNALLGSGQEDARPVVAELAVTATSEEERALLLDLLSAYQEALHPTQFVTRWVERADETFEQCYELMRLTFHPSELNPRERYVERLAAQELTSTAHARVPFVMLARCWRVSGPQRYDDAGRLTRFSFDPLTITEHVAGVVSGTYMTLLSPDGAGRGIGAIGHMVTRESMRRGNGHGRVLASAFEREAAAIAADRGETLSLLALEAEPDAMTFWAKQGYRWPAGSRYAQPPLDFDPHTGERLYDEVPELLMVKVPGDPAATHVNSGLVRDTVSTLYEIWCLARVRRFAPDAAQRAESYVQKVYRAFEASLPPREASIPLAEPPQSVPLLEFID